MPDSDNAVDGFEQDVWGAVADGEQSLLTKEEMSAVLLKAAGQLHTEHYERR